MDGLVCRKGQVLRILPLPQHRLLASAAQTRLLRNGGAAADLFSPLPGLENSVCLTVPFHASSLAATWAARLIRLSPLHIEEEMIVLQQQGGSRASTAKAASGFLADRER
jgi:hypothetical protein